MKSNRFMLLVFAGSVAITGLTGCNVSGYVMDMLPKVVKNTGLTGISPGSNTQKTTGGYTVFSTVGDIYATSPAAGPIATNGGYKVYSGVNSDVASQCPAGGACTIIAQ